MNEVWKQVAGFDDRYEVSSCGRVRSKDMIVSPGGRVLRRNGRLLRLQEMHKGYLNAKLCLAGKITTIRVHRLVAMTFVGPPPFVGAQVNHKDLDKKNNRPDNLEWVSLRQNLEHAWRNGRHPHRKQTEIQ